MNETADKSMQEKLAKLKLIHRIFPEEMYGAEYDVSSSKNPVKLVEIISWWRTLLEARKEKPHPLYFYVHAPFCRSRCTYCQYHSRSLQSTSEIDAYLDEMESLCGVFYNKLGSIDIDAAYIGGGTPSLLSAEQLGRLLQLCYGEWIRLPEEERFFNVELNPDSSSEEKLRILADYGVTRVSMGVQSLYPKVLDWANRDYQSFSDVESAISAARSAGIPEVNFDLIAPLPFETLQSFEEGLTKLLSLKPDSIIIYRFQKSLHLRLKDNPELSFARVSDITRKTTGKKPYRIFEDDLMITLIGNKVTREEGEYQHHTQFPSSILGLGPFSESRVSGIAQYYTRFPSHGASGPYEFFGNPLTLEEEARSRLARAILRTDSVDIQGLCEIYGFDKSLFKEEIEYLEKNGKAEMFGDLIKPSFSDRDDAVFHARLFWSDSQIDAFLLEHGSGLTDSAGPANLVHPFNTEKPVGGWLLAESEVENFVIRFLFRHKNGMEMPIKLVRRGKKSTVVASRNFDICFDGKNIPAKSEKFWRTIIRVIQKNDR